MHRDRRQSSFTSGFTRRLSADENELLSSSCPVGAWRAPCPPPVQHTPRPPGGGERLLVSPATRVAVSGRRRLPRADPARYAERVNSSSPPPQPLPPTVVGAGLVALDVIVEGEEVGLSAGGTCGNVIALLGALGWAGLPIARLNGDRAAKLIKSDLAKAGVDLSFTSETPEAVAPVIIERIGGRRGRDHSFSFKCAVCDGWLPQYRPLTQASAHSVQQRLPAHDVFFYDRVSPSSVALAEASAGRGALVYFEPSAAGDPALMSRALRAAHVVKYSSDRLGDLDDLSTRHLALQVVTSGASGLRYRRKAGNWVAARAPQIERLIDSAGAGDWFSASLLNVVGRRGLASLDALTDPELADAIAGAQRVAAWSCGFRGARGGMLAGASASVPVFGEMKRSEPLTSSGTLAEVMSGLCPSCSGETQTIE